MKTGLVVAYSVMNFGKHAFWSLFNLFGMLYLTEVVGLAPALAGSILLGSLLVDAILDPAIGSVADRVRAGRKDYFEFILMSALACALSITLFFGGYQGSGPWRVLLIGAGLVGFRLAFTLCDLSDNALASRITASARSRTSLSAARNVARALATGLMAATVGLTMSDKIHAGHRLLLMAAATSLLATAAITIAYGRLRPFDRAAPAVSRVSLAIQWRELRKAPQAWLLCAAALLESSGTPIFLTGMAYFGSAAFRDIGWGGTAVLVFSAAQVLSQPLWVRLAAKAGKWPGFIAAHLCGATAAAGFILAGPQSRALALAAAALFGIAGGGVSTLRWSIAPDIIDQLHRQGRVRIEGAFLALLTGAVKLGSGIASAGLGFALSAIGYSGRSGMVAAGAMAMAVAGPAMLLYAACAVLSAIPGASSGGRNAPEIAEISEACPQPATDG